MAADTSYQCHHSASNRPSCVPFWRINAALPPRPITCCRTYFSKPSSKGSRSATSACLFHVAHNVLTDCLRLTKATIELQEDLAREDEAETASIDKLSPRRVAIRSS